MPAKPGVQLDALASTQAILQAALRPRVRVARLVVITAPPKLSTARAEAMNIHSVVSSYTTIYGGIPNRIHNVQLVAHLVDDKLIAPVYGQAWKKAVSHAELAVIPEAGHMVIWEKTAETMAALNRLA